MKPLFVELCILVWSREGNTKLPKRYDNTSYVNKFCGGQKRRVREIRSAVIYNMISAKMPLELKGGERWNHVDIRRKNIKIEEAVGLWL